MWLLPETVRDRPTPAVTAATSHSFLVEQWVRIRAAGLQGGFSF